MSDLDLIRNDAFLGKLLQAAAAEARPASAEAFWKGATAELRKGIHSALQSMGQEYSKPELLEIVDSVLRAPDPAEREQILREFVTGRMRVSGEVGELLSEIVSHKQLVLADVEDLVDACAEDFAAIQAIQEDQSRQLQRQKLLVPRMLRAYRAGLEAQRPCPEARDLDFLEATASAEGRLRSRLNDFRASRPALPAATSSIASRSLEILESQ